MASILSRPQYLKAIHRYVARIIRILLHLLVPVDCFMSFIKSNIINTGARINFPFLVDTFICRKISNITRTKSPNLNVSRIVLQFSLMPIQWCQLLSREWRCRWSSADRRCSKYIWVIDNFIGTHWNILEHILNTVERPAFYTHYT